MSSQAITSLSTSAEIRSRIESTMTRISRDATSVNSKLNSSCKVVPPPTRSNSLIDSWGLRVSQEEKVKGKMVTKFYYICLAGKCGDDGACKTVISLSISSTSNCTNHLRNVHNLVSSKTISRDETMKRLQKQLDTSKPSFLDNPRRWFEVDKCL